MTKEIFEKRIQELEKELKAREQDLSLYKEELVKANQKLEKIILQITHELKVTSQIQKILVPTELPNIPGFEFSSKFIPSSISGGDYFDVFEHEDKTKFGVVLTSASGYGTSSLLLSILLHLTGKMEARQGLDPQNVLAHILKEANPGLKPEDTINAFYGVIDRKSYTLSFCTAGKIMAIYQAYAKDDLIVLEGTEEPLRKTFTGELSAHSVVLNPRDRLYLISLGVARVKNRNDELFGEDRLYKAILSKNSKSVHDVRNEILFQVDKFSEGCEIPRDITVLVIEVKDRVIRLAKK